MALSLRNLKSRVTDYFKNSFEEEKQKNARVSANSQRIRSNIRNTVSQGTQRVVNAYKQDPQQFNFLKQLADRNIQTGSSKLNTAARIVAAPFNATSDFVNDMAKESAIGADVLFHPNLNVEGLRNQPKLQDYLKNYKPKKYSPSQLEAARNFTIGAASSLFAPTAVSSRLSPEVMQIAKKARNIKEFEALIKKSEGITKYIKELFGNKKIPVNTIEEVFNIAKKSEGKIPTTTIKNVVKEVAGDVKKTVTGGENAFTRYISDRELAIFKATGKLPSNLEGYINTINPGKADDVIFGAGSESKKHLVTFKKGIEEFLDSTTKQQSAVKGDIPKNLVESIQTNVRAAPETTVQAEKVLAKEVADATAPQVTQQTPKITQAAQETIGKVPESPVIARNAAAAEKAVQTAPPPKVFHAEPSGKVRLTSEGKRQASVAKEEFRAYQEALNAAYGKPKTPAGNISDLVHSIKNRTVGSGSKNVENLTDIKPWSGQFTDIFRNFRRVYGKQYAAIKEAYLDPMFIKGKTALYDDIDRWIGRIKTEMEQGFGIKKGSQESADVQKFGEKLISAEDLINKYGREKAAKLIEADKWFRRNYDILLEEVNKVRAQIYPNQPEKIIPRRQDYYRHFQELGQGIDGLLNTFTQVADIGSNLAGKSAFTKPKSKLLKFSLPRIGNKTEYDAVGGFIDYVKAQTYAKNIDPHISTFRDLATDLEKVTGDTSKNPKAMNNFISFLNNFSNDLAGKTGTGDRALQEIGGRKGLGVISWLTTRAKLNVILGNASASLAQFFNLPNAIGEVGPAYAAKGFGRTAAEMLSKSKAQSKSIFLRERFFKGWDQFDRGILASPKKFAKWMITAPDEAATRSIWNMFYERGKAQGVPDVVNYADDFTRRMVAGRGIGELPLAQRSQWMQIVAPFQVEVTNAWHVIGDMIGEKAFGKLITLAITSYVMNRTVEKVRGSDVSFDPINAIIDGLQTYQEEEDKRIGALKFGGRLGGEVLSNVPFGQSGAAIYPEYGVNIPGTEERLTREELFGKGDPTRFGSGLLAAKALQDPLYKILPPFGGQQIKRSIKGADVSAKGYSETDKGEVRFPTEDNVLRNAQRVVFGEYSTPAAREYFDKNRRPLGEDKSAAIKASTDKQGTYIKFRDQLDADNTEKAFVESLKNVESGVNSGTINDKLIWLDDKGEKESVDLGKYSQKLTGFAKAELEAEKLTDARAIFKGNATDEEKQKAYKTLGVDPVDVEYDVTANYETRTKVNYYTERSGQISHEELIEELLDGRKQSVSGKYLANEGTLTELRDAGIISRAEWKVLKDTKIDNTGKVISGAGTGKGKKPPKITIKKATLKTGSSGSFKFSGGKLPKVKIAKSPVSTFKIKRAKGSKLPTSYKVAKIPAIKIKKAYNSLTRSYI